MKGRELVRNNFCHGLPTYIITRNKDSVERYTQPVEKSPGKGRWTYLIVSAKFGCINRANSKCKILMEHYMETDIVGSP